MSNIIDMKSFAADKVTPVPDHLQGHLDLALQAALLVLMPPKIRNARVADAHDIELRKDAVLLVIKVAGDLISTIMSELNENLRLDNTIDTTDFFAGLADLKSDLAWMFERAADHE